MNSSCRRSFFPFGKVIAAILSPLEVWIVPSTSELLTLSLPSVHVASPVASLRSPSMTAGSSGVGDGIGVATIFTVGVFTGEAAAFGVALGFAVALAVAGFGVAAGAAARRNANARGTIVMWIKAPS